MLPLPRFQAAVVRPSHCSGITRVEITKEGYIIMNQAAGIIKGTNPRNFGPRRSV